MSFTLVQCAGNMFQPARKRVAAYAAAVSNADVATFTEAQKDHAAIQALGFGAAVLSELAIVWNRDRFDKVDQGGVKVMDGGKHGAGLRIADRRRRGPNRYVLWVVLHEKSTGQDWLIAIHHAIAKPDTSFLWRRRLHTEGLKNAAAEIRKAQSKHPGAQTVLDGDWNRKGAVSFGLGLTEVKTPPTFGKLRYDRVQTDPDVRATGVRTFATGLDHKAIAVRLSAMGSVPKPSPVPAPVPKPEPTPAPKPEVSPMSVEELIALFKAEVGTHEGRSNGHWNNIQKYAKELPGAVNGQAWCDTFVHWGAWKGGVLNLWPDVTKGAPAGSPGCDVTANAWKKAKRWSEYPAVGAQVFFGTKADLSHTGFVIDYNATSITTIEGNTNTSGAREGDGVYLKTHSRRANNVIGYGYPAYPEGIKSADPAWQKKPAPKPPTPAPTPAPRKSPSSKPDLAGFRPRIDGVDLSHHQGGSLNFAKAKAAGVKFVFHKATEGNTFRDPGYSKRRSEVGKAGLPFGGYHFARPGSSSGTAQAQKFLAAAAPKPGDLRPCLDLEDKGGLNAEQLTVWVEQFAAEVEKATGKPPVVYMPSSFVLTRDVGCYLWVPRYSNANALPVIPKPWDRWTIWQFSNGVFGAPRSVDGIGHCDINVLQPGFDLSHLIL